MSGKQAIQVALRVRPKIQLETDTFDATKGKEVVIADEDHNTITIGSVSAGFDRVFGPGAAQEAVYEYIRHSIHQVATGVNATVFTYGQTGSGKTHTMLGTGLEMDLLTAADMNEPLANWGIVPRAVYDLFNFLKEASAEGTSAVVTCSYLQIYNDKLYDLLADRRNKKPLAVREQERGRRNEVFVSGLSEYRVGTAEDVLVLLQIGGSNRAIRGTEANEASSRSHALLQLNVEVETRQEGGSTVIRRAKLNLVDLAGSEKWNTKVDMVKAHQQELVNINKSLSALGNCISALSDPARRHVPYRDSKLTRILQDSLGGNCHTTIIATLSPIAANLEDSISTVQFADRARHVHTKVHVNEVVDDSILLARALKTIAQLKKQLAEVTSDRIAALEAEMQKLKAENANLKEQVAWYAANRSSKHHHRSKHGKSHPQRPSDAHVDVAVTSPELPPRTLPVTPILAPNSADETYGSEFEPDEGTEAVTQLSKAAAATGIIVDENVAFGSEQFGQLAAEVEAATDAELSELMSAVNDMAAQRQALEAQLAALTGGLVPNTDEQDPKSSPDRFMVQRKQLPHSIPALPTLPAVIHASKGLPRLQSEATLQKGAKGGHRAVNSAEPRGNGKLDASPTTATSDGYDRSMSRSQSSINAAKHAAVQLPIVPGLSLDTVYRQKQTIAAGYRPLGGGSMKPPVAAKDVSKSKVEERKHQIRAAYQGMGMAKGDVYAQPVGKHRAVTRSAHADSDASITDSESDREAAANEPLQLCTPRFCFDKRDVGCRVRIHNSRYDEWLCGDVTSFDPLKKMHLVVYDDGSRKWHTMREKDFEIITFAPAQGLVNKAVVKSKGGAAKKSSKRLRKKLTRAFNRGKRRGKAGNGSRKPKPKASGVVGVTVTAPASSAAGGDAYSTSDSESSYTSDSGSEYTDDEDDTGPK